MKILAAQDDAGCGWVRIVQPLRQLAKHGHEVEFISTHDSAAIQSIADGNFDVLVGQRFAGWEGMSLWRKARKPHTRLVYETDDDLFAIEMDNWAAYNSFNRPVIREAILGYCDLADLVTVTTDTLAKVHREHRAARTAVLPNCIPEYVLDLPRKKHERPRIGWVGGASHGMDIHEATKPVRRFLQRNDNWDLYLGGTDYRPSFDLRNWDQAIHGEWNQINDDERGYYESTDFDIGICPLRDTTFNRSKSYIKALEYGARGIPVIASNVGPYKDYVKHGYNGYLVNGEHEWSKYLRLLAENPDLRAEMGAAGKFEASKHTLENNWQKWQYAYEDLF